MGDTIKLIVDEHRSFSEQIFKLAKSDLVRTYRGAALGWIWALVKPSMTLFVFWFAFTVGLRSGKPVKRAVCCAYSTALGIGSAVSNPITSAPKSSIAVTASGHCSIGNGVRALHPPVNDGTSTGS